MAQIKDIFGRDTPLQVAQKIDWEDQQWSIIITKDNEGNTRFITSCISPVDLKVATFDLMSIMFNRTTVVDI